MQTEITCYPASTLRNFFLYAAIGNKRIRLVCHHIAKLGYKHTFGYCASHGHHMALSQRTGTVFHSTLDIQLRMTGSHTSPLAELFKLIHAITSCKSKYAVQHRRHVPRIHKEPVAGYPFGITRIVYNMRREKRTYKIGTAHSATGVS